MKDVCGKLNVTSLRNFDSSDSLTVGDKESLIMIFV